MNIKYDILVDHIREEMKKKNIRTMKQLAGKLGIEAGTLSNNIKYISKIDKFDTPFFEKLVSILEVDSDKFIEKIKKDLKSEDSLVKNIINDYYDEAEKEHKDYYQTLIDLISSLGEGDTYTLVSSDIPLEFIGYEKYVNSIIQSLMSGANFRYVFPDSESDSFKDEFNKYWPKPTPEWLKLEELYESFLDKITRENLNSSSDLDCSLNELRNERLRCIKCNDPYLMHPFFKFMWLHKDEKKGSKKLDLVFAEYRVGKPNSSDVSSQYRLWYPLPEIEGKKIIKQINHYDHESK